MSFPLHPFAILSIVSSLVALIALITAWRRSATGLLSLTLLLISMVIWSGFYSVRWMDISLESEIFLFKLMYVGITALPTLFLLFILEFTRMSTWLTPRNLVLLSIQPVASLLLVWTNEYHKLYYVSMITVQKIGFPTTEFLRGPWYYVNVLYSYLIIGIALIVLTRATLRSGPMYRHQYSLIFLGSLIPWVSNIYSEYNFEALGGLDLAPVTFGLSGIVFVFAILRARFLDFIPVARSYVIESMRDGILVIDTQNRIIDINPAMENFLGGKPSSYMGRNAYDVFAGWVEHPDCLWQSAETRSELRFPRDPSRYLDLRVTSLYDKNQHLNGRLMVFHEITDGKKVEKRLRDANDRLHNQVIEIGLLQSKLREQAIRDPLTNLFNRRYLEETLDRELARAGRECYPLCIIMIDLDHFKRVNDTYGHEAGDHVLQAIASTISEQSRRGDFACRYGGEEFVIVMPNSSTHMGYERARRLRRRLNSLDVSYDRHRLSVTTSMGIACFPRNGETRDSLLRAADKAMYASKQAGRDHILSYDQLQMSDTMPKA